MKKKRKSNKKKGVSPVIATVLLIAMVIIIAIIILAWSWSFLEEKILKFEKPIENVCSEVSIRTFVNDDAGKSFGFSNIGNVPIFAVDLKLSDLGSGNSDVIRINGQVDVGLSKTLDGYSYNNYEEVKIIPVLLGKTQSGAVKEYTCPEKASFVV